MHIIFTWTARSTLILEYEVSFMCSAFIPGKIVKPPPVTVARASHKAALKYPT